MGCKKEHTTTQTANVDVYLAGNSFVNNQLSATYWKNANSILLDMARLHLMPTPLP